MNTLTKVLSVGILALMFNTNALASDKVDNAIIGAGLGAAAGALVSEGDPAYILGGAAAGGVLGHVLTGENQKKYKRHGHKNYRQVSYRHGNSMRWGHGNKHKKYKKYRKHYYR